MDNQPTSLNCPACGAPLDFDGTSAVVRCKFCRNVSLIPGILPTQAAAPSSALDEIRLLASSGKQVEAIKRYREIYGVDLNEANDGVEALQSVSQDNDGSYLYRGVICCIRSGLQGYAIRVQPRHPLLGSAGIPGMVLWSN